jgi:hypothetical protein
LRKFRAALKNLILADRTIALKIVYPNIYVKLNRFVLDLSFRLNLDQAPELIEQTWSIKYGSRDSPLGGLVH